MSAHAHLPRKEVELGFRLDWGRDAQKLEGGLVLEILRERPPTCPVTAGQSCLEKGAHIEPALSLAQQGARAASIRANWQLRHTRWHPSRPHAPRQASLQAWPTAAIDYRQGSHRGPGRGCYLTDFLHAAAPDLGVELISAQSPRGPARSSRKLRPGGLKGGLRGKRS